MADSKQRVFEYSRGPNFTVAITVADNGTMTFHALKIPDNTPPNIAEVFLEEAELYINKQLEKEYENRYAH